MKYIEKNLFKLIIYINIDNIFCYCDAINVFVLQNKTGQKIIVLQQVIGDLVHTVKGAIYSHYYNYKKFLFI